MKQLTCLLKTALVPTLRAAYQLIGIIGQPLSSYSRFPTNIENKAVSGTKLRVLLLKAISARTVHWKVNNF